MTTSQTSQAPTTACIAGFESHNHTSCITDALEAAEKICGEQELRFTPVRRKVLELLLKEHRALRAYSILDSLREAGFGSQPPVVYRALDFLTENGFAHRIERLNAFVACSHSDKNHSPAFMICRNCDAVAEVQSAPANESFGNAARAVGFRVEKITVEAEGICPACFDKTDL